MLIPMIMRLQVECRSVERCVIVWREGVAEPVLLRIRVGGRGGTWTCLWDRLSRVHEQRWMPVRWGRGIWLCEVLRL